MENVNAHYERMGIVRPAYEKFNYLPLWALLRETVNLNSRDKAPSPAMAGATARAIFSGARYPASLLEAVMPASAQSGTSLGARPPSSRHIISKSA